MGFLGKVFDQVNPFDHGKTYSNQKPQAKPQPKVNAQQLAQALQVLNHPAVQQHESLLHHLGTGLGLAGLRSVTGLGQGVSGLYDLATPGKGTNRFSKQLNTLAQSTDATAKAEHINPILYHGGQAATDLLTLAAGSALAQGTKAGTAISTGNKAVESAVKNRTASLATRGFGGKVGAKTIQNLAKPGYQATNLAFTGLQAGKQASQGQRVTPQGTLINLGVGGVAFPVAGALAGESLRAIKPGAVKTATTVSNNLNTNKLQGRILGVQQAKEQNIAYRQAAQSRGDVKGSAKLDAEYKQMVQLENRLKKQLDFQNKSIGLSIKKVGGESAIDPIPPAIGQTGKPGSSKVSSTDALAQRDLSKTGTQLLPQELPPQTELRIGNQRTTKLSSPSTSVNNTTKVGLNTARLDLGKKGQNNLDNATHDVIARLSNDDIQQMAKDVGLDTKTHSQEQTRKIIAEQLNVRRDAVRLQNEAEVARKSGDLATAEQLLKASAERGRVSRAQGTDLAQQLQARRIIANELDTPQQRIFKLLDNAGVNPEVYTKRLAGVDFTNAKDVVTAYRDLVPAKAGDWLDTVRYNSMLSSPLTHAVNAVSNAINVGVVAPVEKTLRGTLDAVGGLFGHERQYAAGEGGAYVSGAVQNIRKAADNFVDAMRGTPQNFNLDLTEYSTPLAVGGAKGAIYNTLSYPMRLLGASDKFFRTLASGGEESALALRAKKGIAVKGDVKELGQAEADYRLFQQDTNLPGQGSILDSVDSVTNSIMALRRDHTWAKFVFPFVKTPTNILKQGVEFSPLGFANAVKAEDKVTAITRAAIGTAVFGASAAMLSTGDLTWGEPTNKQARDRFKAEGKQPYALRIGGKWVSFSKLPPAISFPFALTAGIDDAIKNKKMSADTADAILEGVAKWGQFLGDQSYVKNIGDTLAAFKGDSEKVVTAVSNYPQQVIPFRALTGWLARMSDPTERQVNTDKGFIDKQVQSLMMNYPGLREKLDTRDYRGAPIPANNPVLNSFTPIKVTNDRGTNPIDQAKDAAKQAQATTPDIPAGHQKTYQKYIDKQVNKAQNQLIKTPEYNALDAKGKGKALDSLKTKYTHAYKRQFMADNGIPINDQPNATDVKILTNKANIGDLATKPTTTKKPKTPKIKVAKAKKIRVSKGTKGRKVAKAKAIHFKLPSTPHLAKVPRAKGTKGKQLKFKVAKVGPKPKKIKLA